MRYYFHVSGAAQLIDEEGCEFASPAEARLQAVRSAGEYLRDQPDAVMDGKELQIEVTDSGRHPVFSFTASSSVANKLM